MLYAYAFATQNSKTMANWCASKVCNVSKKTQHDLNHMIDRKHTLLNIKFELRSSTPFTRKLIF